MFKIFAILVIALYGSHVSSAPAAPFFMKTVKTEATNFSKAGAEIKASFVQLGVYSPAEIVELDDFDLDIPIAADATNGLPTEADAKSSLASASFMLLGEEVFAVADVCNVTGSILTPTFAFGEVNGFEVTNLICSNGEPVKSVSLHASTMVDSDILDSEEFHTGMCFPVPPTSSQVARFDISLTCTSVAAAPSPDANEAPSPEAEAPSPEAESITVTCTIDSAKLVGGESVVISGTVKPASGYLLSTQKSILDPITFAKASELLGGDFSALDPWMIDDDVFSPVYTYVTMSDMPCAGASSTVPPVVDGADDSYMFHTEVSVATHAWDGKDAKMMLNFGGK